MDKLVNVEVLGRPVNWMILLLLIVLVWTGAFAVLRAKVATILPADKDDK